MATALCTRLRLRPGVQILRAGPREFLLLSPVNGKQLSCGAEERYLLHLLERCETYDAVRAAFAKRFGAALAERPLLEFVEQLRQLDLIAPDAEEVAAPVVVPQPTTVSAPAPGSAADPQARLNRFFDYLLVWFGWLLHPLWTIPILLLTVVAMAALIHHRERILPSLALPRDRLPSLLLLFLLPTQTLFLLGLPYNLLLGMICRRYGGRVREFGLMLYEDFVPTFYCNFGDSHVQLKDPGQWSLILARIWCTLAVGAVSVLAWANCKPGSIASAFWIWMLPPCLGGLFFQIVPYFQGAAYWALCKHYEEPYLHERAMAETWAWLTWQRSPEALSAIERYWLRVWGLGYYLFRLVFDSVVILVLGYFVTQRFRGAGALVFSGILLYWYRNFLGNALMTWWNWLIRGGGPWWFHWPVRVVLLAGVVALGFVPYSYEIVGECRLIPQSQYGVRAQLTDEITDVHVKEGDYVPPGSVIATLSGRSVRESYLATDAELRRAQAQLDLLRAGYRAEDVKIAEQRVELALISVRYYEELMKREERLVATNSVSREHYDRYRREYDSAKEKLLGAQENLGKLKSGYREEEIRAAEAAVQTQQEKKNYYEELLTLTKVVTPFGGRVVTPYMEQKRGQQAKSGDLLAVLHDTSRLLVEVAAEDSAAAEVRPGMHVHVRLYARNGQLLTGTVQRVANTAEQDRTIGVTPIRTDHESYQEQIVNARAKSGTSYHVRVYVVLDEPPPGLSPDLTGYARIVVQEDDVLWQALVRPVARFLRTDVWSWLP